MATVNNPIVLETIQETETNFKNFKRNFLFSKADEKQEDGDLIIIILFFSIRIIHIDNGVLNAC